MIQDFVHVNISVSDLDRAISYYQKLGLEVTKRIGELDSEGVAAAFKLQRGNLNVVHLRPKNSSGNMRIDLVEWLNPSPQGPTYPALNNLGLVRLAFTVDDLEKTVEKLRSEGLDFLSDVQSFGQGITSVVTTDPDGTFIQLIQGLK